MKFKPEITNIIIEAISKGIPKKYAVQGCGLNESTFYKWMEEGENDFNNSLDTEKAKFFKSVKIAESQAVEYLLNIIKEAAKDRSWQAAAWILERTHVKDFGRFTKHELFGNEEKPGFNLIIESAFVPDGLREK